MELSWAIFAVVWSGLSVYHEVVTQYEWRRENPNDRYRALRSRPKSPRGACAAKVRDALLAILMVVLLGALVAGAVGALAG